jgi:hypothetical protein
MEEDGRDQASRASESSALDAMAALFKFLTNNAIILDCQVTKGVSRHRKSLPDLKLDVPAAEQKILNEFEGIVKDGGFLHVSSSGEKV